MEFYKTTPHVFNAKSAAIRYFVAKDLLKPYEHLNELYQTAHAEYTAECMEYLNLSKEYAEGLFIQDMNTLDTISRDNWWGFPLLALEYDQYLKQLNAQFEIQNNEFKQLQAKGGREAWVKMSILLDTQQDLKEAVIGCLARKTYVDPAQETPTWEHCIRTAEIAWKGILDFHNSEYYKSNAKLN